MVLGVFLTVGRTLKGLFFDDLRVILGKTVSQNVRFRHLECIFSIAVF